LGSCLFVGENQHHRVLQFLLAHQPMKLRPRFIHALAAVAIDHEYHSLRPLEVVPPKRSNRLLSAHVHHRESHILVLHSLNIQPNRGNGPCKLAQLQHAQDARLPRPVESDHQDAHILFSAHQPLQGALDISHSELCSTIFCHDLAHVLTFGLKFQEQLVHAQKIRLVF
jgi:hypothetical protein